MGTLKISLFGCLRIISMRDSSEIQLTRSVQALLAYLLLKRGRTVSRDQLADLFWGELDEQHAHNCLNTALWRLRSIFRQYSAENIQAPRFLVTNSLGEVSFDKGDNCWLDIVEFGELWELIPKHPCDLTQQDQKNLNRLVELYEGDLLERFDHDWILPERERYRLMYLSSLARLMDDYHHKNILARSLECGQRILSVDPLREDIHRELMQLYLELGQRATAIQQYKVCSELLSRELGISPMIETQMLYERVLSESEPCTQNLKTALRKEASEEYGDLLAHVENAIARFEQARHDLHQARQILERCSEVHKHP